MRRLRDTLQKTDRTRDSGRFAIDLPDPQPRTEARMVINTQCKDVDHADLLQAMQDAWPTSAVYLAISPAPSQADADSDRYVGVCLVICESPTAVRKHSRESMTTPHRG